MFHVAAGLHFIKIVERLQSRHIRTERLGVYNHNNPTNRLFFMPSQYRRGRGGGRSIDRRLIFFFNITFLTRGTQGGIFFKKNHASNVLLLGFWACFFFYQFSTRCIRT